MNARLYHRMLRLYPQAFRDEFGAEMAAVFEDALRDAHQRGTVAVLKLWWREIVLFPRSVFGAGAPLHWSGRLVALVAILLLLGTGNLASYFIAKIGLFNVASLAVLATGLLGAGALFGAAVAGRHVKLLSASIAIAVITFIAAPLIDRILLDHVVDKTTLTIPGVRLDAARVTDAKAYHAMVENARASNTNRLRVHTRTVDDLTRVSIVRSGGVDGAYMLLTMVAVTMCAAGSWRWCRAG